MTIIGVPNPGDGDEADKQAFIDAMSSPIPHVRDAPGELWAEYGVVSQPTMVFVSADGTTEVRTGSLGPHGLLSRAKELESAET